MVRICFFSGDISRSGGTERVTTVIASELARRGHTVCILSMSNGMSTFFPLHTGVRLISLHMEKYSANFSDAIIWWRLHKFLKQELVDYIIDVDVILSWYSIISRICTTSKVVSWEHFHFDINVGDALQRLKRSVARRMAARFSHVLVTLTKKDRTKYQRALQCKTPIKVISNPNTIDHTLRSDLHSKVVLAAGRLVPQKGFDLLLKAWSLAIQAAPDWKLRIIGSGPDEDMLKRLAVEMDVIDTVEFQPQTSDIESQFLSSSIFALSSRFEGFVLVLVEAKSFGLPSVSFDCDCGPSDIIRHREDGILVQPGDVDGFSKGLIELMTDGDKRQSFGDSAFADGRFDLKCTVDQWERLFS